MSREFFVILRRFYELLAFNSNPKQIFKWQQKSDCSVVDAKDMLSIA